MPRRYGRLVLLFFVLLLLAHIEAAPRRRVQRSAAQSEAYSRAAAEIARGRLEPAIRPSAALPLTPRNLVTDPRSAYRVGGLVRKELERQKLLLDVRKQENQQILTAIAASAVTHSAVQSRAKLKTPESFHAGALDALLGRTAAAILWRDRVLDEVGAEQVAFLEGRRQEHAPRSELEDQLVKAGVADFREVANSFDLNAYVKLITFQKEVTLLRIFGGESKPNGRYLFCCLEEPVGTLLPLPGGRPTHRWADANGLATPRENLLQDLAVVKLPAGTSAFIGPVADNFYDHAGQPLRGGNAQIFLPAVHDFPYDHYRLAGAPSDPSDIVVFFENDKVLRFKRSR